MKTRTAIIFTLINAILAIAAIICLVRVSDNNEALNAVSTDFDFTEKECGVQLNLNSGKTAMLKFGKNDVRIENAYLYNDADSIAELLLFARYYASRAGYKIDRTNTELIGEYRLHTILYRMGYKRERTGVLNWDYSRDPRPYVNAASKALGWLAI